MVCCVHQCHHSQAGDHVFMNHFYESFILLPFSAAQHLQHNHIFGHLLKILMKNVWKQENGHFSSFSLDFALGLVCKTLIQKQLCVQIKAFILMPNATTLINWQEADMEQFSTLCKSKDPQLFPFRKSVKMIMVPRLPE